MPDSSDSPALPENLPDGLDNARHPAALHIRPAVAADAETLGVLWRDTVETLTRLDRRLKLAPNAVDRWREAFVAGLSRADQYSVVAVRDRAIIAGMTGQIIPNAPGFLPEKMGLISELIVDSHGRGGRIGTQLYEALGAWFSSHDVTLIEARVPAANPIAQAFWRALGAADVYQYLRLKQTKTTANPVDTKTI
jgi:GNAT superfamily N-acetyltransferase